MDDDDEEEEEEEEEAEGIGDAMKGESSILRRASACANPL